MTSDGSNWEAALLQQTLSKRVAAIGTVWWIAGGRQEPPPVEPVQLTGGIPDEETLPVDALMAASERVLRREAPDALRYGGSQGYLGLREFLAEHLSKQEGLALTADNLTITNGASAGIANVGEAFLDEGDVALVEQPTYPGGVGTMRGCLGDVVGVPLDAGGLVPEALDETIERLKAEGRRVKLLYTIASYQNPTGAAMTLDRRKAVVDICRRQGVITVEDEAYADLGFDGRTLPSLFSLAGGEGAVTVGTFSKTIATGLRVGWVLGSVPMTESLVRMRFDMGTSPWVQRTIAEYASTGEWVSHTKEMQRLYRHKRDVMLGALEERCSRYTTWNVPEGGFFLWLRLSDEIDPRALADTARNIGVAYVGGAAFYQDRKPGLPFVRLAFSHATEAEITEGVLRLGRALEQAAASSPK
jgi:DNA-binding transcriptional MocR family regulator